MTILPPPVERPISALQPAPFAVRPRGAVILGGAHGAIALARSLKRRGLRVVLVTDDTPLPGFSSAIDRKITWPGSASDEALGRLEQIAQDHDLHGYLLVPAADADVRFAAMAHDRLSSTFSVLLPDWDSLQWACDKGLAYDRAEELGLSVPRIYRIASLDDARHADLQFPVVLKPTMRVSRNRFTSEKAWRVDDWGQFQTLYQEAVSLVGAKNIVVQEMVVGDGRSQLSYAGLWHKGEPVIGFTATRLRQYPVEFSYTSTYVETSVEPEVVAASEKFLRSIGHHGLVEIEYKRDSRDGRLKLLDINPRPWSWFALADAAGIDFGAAILALACGEAVPVMTAMPSIGWMFLVRDIVASAQTWRHGTLRPRDYFASWLRTRSFATFSWRDPLPALIEMPLTVWRVIGRRLKAH
ncbi:carboxylate--amine ligase [Devosia epidermidihirudinis]|uniref:carboxylate--amine ligase n=1 Tax=Devosia epidermidihirudinis TaxID=1293439 RepID=UPI000A9CADEE|nr:ATP-grasp domain-containing protein [Devosia epidermidihirudinis]